MRILWGQDAKRLTHILYELESMRLTLLELARASAFTPLDDLRPTVIATLQSHVTRVEDHLKR